MHVLHFLKIPLLAAVMALTVGAVTAPVSALADASHDAPSRGPAPAGADHGMTPAEHAAHGAAPAPASPSAAAGHEGHGAHGGSSSPPPDREEEEPGRGPPDEHSASAGHDAGHGAAEPTEERPVKLVLGGFAAFNGFVLLVAALLRRRPDAIKRRETLARVRRAAGARESEPSGEAVS
jgi:hypothetical protein